MTVHISQATAKKLGILSQSTPTPQPPTPRHKVIRERVEQTEWVWGAWGHTAHLWAKGRKADCSGYVSRCLRYSTSRKPNGKRGKRECALCKEEVA